MTKSETQLTLQERLLQDSQKMKWHTPDGWEIQELIPVEYVVEMLPDLFKQALTTLDSELEGMKVKEFNSDGVQIMGAKSFNAALSEAQKLIRGKLG